MGSNWNLQSQLLVAIQTNDIARANHLLEQGVDADSRFQIGCRKRPAVCLGVERGNADMVLLLLRWGCSINQADSQGLTPLHIAASHSDAAMVTLLLKNRAHVNAITEQGYTPLHFASQRSSAATTKRLVEAGAEVERMDPECKTSLLHACIHGCEEVATYLVQNGADANTADTFGNTPLLYAVNAMHFGLQAVAALINAGAIVSQHNSLGEMPLHAVVRGRRPDKLQLLDLLMSSRCDLNACTNLGHTALHLAALQHDGCAAVKLIRSGCDVNVRDGLGLTPLFYLLRDGYGEPVPLLVEGGATVDAFDWLTNRGLQNDAKDQILLQTVLDLSSKCLTLTAICRNVLRRHYGPLINAFVKATALPHSLSKYLLLD